ncbi:PREDICTED: uncharacterized protein LOC105453459 isoform X2 [Wasmannia auropunctata]|uniref:uncharacterized protein LOC105453459 isoform X2 n=1 Tax=Wasmannia auropunctata TaxID=64793 RepID=UPI0005F04251|nr:PREDICTED: uncharacterized protein LOC105453459 isoform X2 [Wasmannia auropunctata]
MSDSSSKRKRSFVHKFFKKYNETSVQCTLCLKVYKNHGNTTNMTSHLRRIHPGHIDSEDSSAQKKICDTPTSINQESEDDPTPVEPNSPSPSTSTSTQSRRSRSCTPLCISEEEIPALIRSTSPSIIAQKQPSIIKAFHKMKTYIDGGSMAFKITNAILYMIAVDRQPFSIVEDKGFRSLLSIVAPLYTVPCRKTITKRMDEKAVQY